MNPLLSPPPRKLNGAYSTIIKVYSWAALCTNTINFQHDRSRGFSNAFQIRRKKRALYTRYILCVYVHTYIYIYIQSCANNVECPVKCCNGISSQCSSAVKTTSLLRTRVTALVSVRYRVFFSSPHVVRVTAVAPDRTILYDKTRSFFPASVRFKNPAHVMHSFRCIVRFHAVCRSDFQRLYTGNPSRPCVGRTSISVGSLPGRRVDQRFPPY